MADGAPLLLVWTEAAIDRSIQSAAKTRVHEHVGLWRRVVTDGSGDVQTHPVLSAGVAVGRISRSPRDPLRRHVRHAWVHPRTRGDGRAARMGQLCVDGDGVEASA